VNSALVTSYRSPTCVHRLIISIIIIIIIIITIIDRPVV
jgi:hypothetical protein